MTRADLRRIREQLEGVRAVLIAANRCSGPGATPEQTYAYAVGSADEQLKDIIARLPGAAENAGRAERLAENARRRPDSLAAVVPIGASNNSGEER